MKMKRTAWGVHSNPLIAALGFEALLLNELLPLIKPRCSMPSCDGQAETMQRLLPADLNLNGQKAKFVVLAVADRDHALTLGEQIEFLGASFGVVSNKLVRSDEIANELGLPVIYVGATENRAEFIAAADSWFAKGGGGLSVFLFDSRDSDGTILATLSRDFICTKCTATAPAISKAELEAVPVCVRCTGVGWFEKADLVKCNRLLPCPDCDGFGSVGRFERYFLKDTPFPNILQLNFKDIYSLLISGEIDALERKQLIDDFKQVVDFGLGSYPIGQPVDDLADDERIALTMLIASFSKYRGDALFLDGRKLGIPQSKLLDLINKAADYGLKCQALRPEDDSTITGSPFYETSRKDSRTADGVIPETASIYLKNIDQAPFVVDRVSFPLRAVSLVSGEFGSSGERFLTEVIAPRFLKRRQLSDSVSFGDCKTCVQIDPFNGFPESDSLLELLGLRDLIAGDFAKTSYARRHGISEADLRAYIDNSSPNENEICAVQLGGLTPMEIMSDPITIVEKALQNNFTIADILSLLSDELKAEWALGMSTSEISWDHKYYLYTASRVIASAKTHQKPNNTLVLVCRPFALNEPFRAKLFQLFQGLCSGGATIIVADKGSGVESWFDHVVYLGRRDARVAQRVGWGGEYSERYCRTIDLVRL